MALCALATSLKLVLLRQLIKQLPRQQQLALLLRQSRVPREAIVPWLVGTVASFG